MYPTRCLRRHKSRPLEKSHGASSSRLPLQTRSDHSQLEQWQQVHNRHRIHKPESRTGGWKAPAIETGISDAEDCGYHCEQEVFESRDRYYTGESSEHELQDEVCSAIAWQTGHECGE